MGTIRYYGESYNQCRRSALNVHEGEILALLAQRRGAKNMDPAPIARLEHRRIAQGRESARHKAADMRQHEASPNGLAWS